MHLEMAQQSARNRHLTEKRETSPSTRENPRTNERNGTTWEDERRYDNRVDSELVSFYCQV